MRFRSPSLKVVRAIPEHLLEQYLVCARSVGLSHIRQIFFGLPWRRTPLLLYFAAHDELQNIFACFVVILFLHCLQ